MLYGHSHGMLPEDHTRTIDVGVDVWDFYPVSIEEVKAKMVRKLPAWLEYQETLKGLGRVEEAFPPEPTVEVWDGSCLGLVLREKGSRIPPR